MKGDEGGKGNRGRVGGGQGNRVPTQPPACQEIHRAYNSRTQSLQCGSSHVASAHPYCLELMPSFWGKRSHIQSSTERLKTHYLVQVTSSVTLGDSLKLWAQCPCLQNWKTVFTALRRRSLVQIHRKHRDQGPAPNRYQQKLEDFARVSETAGSALRWPSKVRCREKTG